MLLRCFDIDLLAYWFIATMAGLHWFAALMIALGIAFVTYRLDVLPRYHAMRSYGDVEDADFDALPGCRK